MRKNYTIFIMSVIAAAITFVLIPRSTHALTFKSSTPISFTFNPTLTLSISGDLEIDELVPGTQADSDGIQIDVSTNVAGGYYLTATVGSSSTDNRLTNQDNPNYFFESLSTDADLPDMSEANDNTWGYASALGGGDRSNYSGLPLDADDTGATGAVLLDTTGPSQGPNFIIFYIAAKASATQPAGIYSNVINFYAVSKPLPEAKTIEDLEYMQEFATLDSIDKESVLTSMTLNQQYTLKDSRDNKEYYIAKLADGNVWMTQNLDHNIVTTTGFYTSENTDLDLPDGANFTMNTATYATDDTDWDNSLTSPRSYDPGNLCWNGIIGNDPDGTLDNSTVPCENDNIHYSIGNYYNWTAAVAMNDSSSYTTRYQDVGQSICPAGWRLPTTTENNYNKSYQNLATSLSLTAGPQGNIQNNPVYFVYGGKLDSSGVWQVGSTGSYWSSVVFDDFESYRLYYSDDDSSLYPQTSDVRAFGYSVRCVAR